MSNNVSAHSQRTTEFERRAIQLSLEHMESGAGGPFGAVIAKGDEIISTGWNQVTSSNDPTAHAEVVAIRKAATRLASFNLGGCMLYCSCEPCPMCLGAIYWARLDGVVYAASRADAAAIGFSDAEIYTELALPIAKRRMPMQQILRPEALKVFELWEKKLDKIRY